MKVFAAKGLTGDYRDSIPWVVEPTSQESGMSTSDRIVRAPLARKIVFYNISRQESPLLVAGTGGI